jgi:hypothetical protein
LILLRFIRLARLNLSPSYKSYENPGSDILAMHSYRMLMFVGCIFFILLNKN